MSVDLLVQIGTLVLVGYVGWHLRREIRTLKGAVDAQKATIDAQVKHREDFEALNRTMKQTVDTMQTVIAFVNPEVQLKREQAFQAQIERDTAARIETVKGQVQQFAELTKQELENLIGSVFGTIARMLPYVPPEQARRLIATSNLSQGIKSTFLRLLDEPPQVSVDRSKTLDELLGLGRPP